MKKIFTLFAALAMVMSMSAKPYLRGSFNGWGTGNEFQNGECTMNLSANTEYEFKVDQNGDWGTSYGNATITSSKCSNIKLSSGSNAKITTALKGDYKFTWNASNQTLTVVYPTEEVVKPKKDITVKAKMPAHWTKTIDAWVWTDEDGNGKPVTPERDGDWYVITQNTAASYIIFRNGATWSGDANQTVDMRFEDNACIQLAQSGSAKATYTNIDCVSEFTLTATANPAEGGSVTGAGVYEEGTTVTLTATPNEGYEFVSWTNGGAEVSTNATYSFVIKANMALVANFKAEEATVYTISTEAVNGTVTGAGVYEEGATVTLTATPADGYNFKNWTVSGAEVSAENPYIFTATADVTVTANFEEIPVEYETVYFVNAQKWAGTINAYAWTDGVGDNHAWPGLPATKETEQIAGCDVYSYTAEAGTYAKVIFNNGTNKTDDLEWTAGKYYVGNEWLTKEEAEDALNKPVVITYVLMGVNDDWTTGIAMTVNPENANEYMLLNQPIAEGDSVKVVTLTNGVKTAYCGDVKEGVTVTITPDDKSGNIILAPGNYDFYYDVTANNIWIAAVSETPGTPDTPATYYVTGNEALLGDKAWNPDAIAMTEVAGVYTHTFTAVAAGVECQLKVTKGDWVNGVWGYDNLSNTPDGVTTDGDRNIIFTLAEDGDVLVTFDGKKITVEGNFEVSDEPQVITYVLMGVGGDWKTGIALTKNEQAEGEEYQLLGQTISEGDAVKVVTLNNGTAIAWCGNVEEASVAHTADGNGNIVLAPGKYDFYFKVNDPATADDDIIYIGISTTTALDNVNTTVAPVKAIVNGQLVIIRDGVKYNVQGAVVK